MTREERVIGWRLVLSSAAIGILTGLLAFGLMKIGWFESPDEEVHPQRDETYCGCNDLARREAGVCLPVWVNVDQRGNGIIDFLADQSDSLMETAKRCTDPQIAAELVSIAQILQAKAQDLTQLN